MASQKTIETVKATAPVLAVHGEKITTAFYEILFDNHPELRTIFNMTHQQKGTQQKVLANAVLQYAKYIGQLEMLQGAVAGIVQKHTSLSITPEMYDIVGENLLKAIKLVLGDVATDDIINAWAEAYQDLANLLIEAEEQVYKQREAQIGGFRGQKEFKIVRRVEESSVITSFYLCPTDNSKCPSYASGQYISITLDIPSEPHAHTRNYSLSDISTSEYLRISVKKEESNPHGIVSNYLHNDVHEGDIIKVGIPSGEFMLKSSDSPVVLLAGGVGITPILSMYKSLIEENKREVVLIQCALNESVLAFQDEIKEYKTDKVKVITVLENDLGYLTKEILQPYLPDTLAGFYFCGPSPFMANVLSILEQLDISQDQINYEFFGPKEELVLS